MVNRQEEDALLALLDDDTSDAEGRACEDSRRGDRSVDTGAVDATAAADGAPTSPRRRSPTPTRAAAQRLPPSLPSPPPPLRRAKGLRSAMRAPRGAGADAKPAGRGVTITTAAPEMTPDDRLDAIVRSRQLAASREALYASLAKRARLDPDGDATSDVALAGDQDGDGDGDDDSGDSGDIDGVDADPAARLLVPRAPGDGGVTETSRTVGQWIAEGWTQSGWRHQTVQRDPSTVPLPLPLWQWLPDELLAPSPPPPSPSSRATGLPHAASADAMETCDETEDGDGIAEAGETGSSSSSSGDASDDDREPGRGPQYRRSRPDPNPMRQLLLEALRASGMPMRVGPHDPLADRLTTAAWQNAWAMALSGDLLQPVLMGARPPPGRLLDALWQTLLTLRARLEPLRRRAADLLIRGLGRARAADLPAWLPSDAARPTTAAPLLVSLLAWVLRHTAVVPIDTPAARAARHAREGCGAAWREAWRTPAQSAAVRGLVALLDVVAQAMAVVAAKRDVLAGAVPLVLDDPILGGLPLDAAVPFLRWLAPLVIDDALAGHREGLESLLRHIPLLLTEPFEDFRAIRPWLLPDLAMADIEADADMEAGQAIKDPDVRLIRYHAGLAHSERCAMISEQWAVVMQDQACALLTAILADLPVPPGSPAAPSLVRVAGPRTWRTFLPTVTRHLTLARSTCRGDAADTPRKRRFFLRMALAVDALVAAMGGFTLLFQGVTVIKHAMNLYDTPHDVGAARHPDDSASGDSDDGSDGSDGGEDEDEDETATRTARRRLADAETAREMSAQRRRDADEMPPPVPLAWPLPPSASAVTSGFHTPAAVFDVVATLPPVAQRLGEHETLVGTLKAWQHAALALQNLLSDPGMVLEQMAIKEQLAWIHQGVTAFRGFLMARKHAPMPALPRSVVHSRSGRPASNLVQMPLNFARASSSPSSPSPP
ncbi:hypothetical protein CXG81DRAFT_26524 [Caulochytrium protostelioides]|uniref:Uncharacterized protein n=1 Tax=Caulochytrium protostelioides TaxID=1555241 RepID=A0A4P9X6X2_9FUNG|nr:hypothetical protein CXG81DRAFT_26524 [Caulochytrium protostelioides]|eukprot:RKP00780.1 hypothetical protein CXG81DRAFT_26524 [Caulochytrium protostelioides]